MSIDLPPRPARDGETLSAASVPPEPPTLMSEEARAEIEEFRGHLIEHVGTTAAGCRFCAARDASLRAARSASGEDSSNV